MVNMGIKWLLKVKISHNWIMNKENPFNPNAVVPPALFAGRSQQVLDILSKLRRVATGQPASFVLYGERGVGKTALARLIHHIAQSQDPQLHNLKFLTSYCAVDKKRSLQSVLEASLNALTDDLPETTLQQLTNKLGGIFKNGKFSFGAFGFNASLDNQSTEHEIYFRDQIISSLSNIVKSVIMDDKKFNGILIIIDEIHNIEDLRNTASIFKGIINTLNFRDRGYISFLIIGYSHSVEAFFEGDPSARRNFDFTQLDVMPTKEAEELLIKGFKKIQIDYDHDVLSNKIEIAGGYPHALQILGRQLVDVDQDNNIDDHDWSQAITGAAQELQAKDFFDFYPFTNKQTNNKKIMNILALSNGQIAIDRHKLQKILGQSIYKNVAQLLSQGAIKEDDPSGHLSLQSKLLSASISFYLKSQAQAKFLQEAESHIAKLKLIEQP